MSSAAPQPSVCNDRPPRLDCFIHAEVEVADGIATRVTIRNISLGGMRAEGPHLLKEGDAITVNVQGLGRMPGQVIWTQPGVFGVQFQLPIDPAQARKINAQNPWRGARS